MLLAAIFCIFTLAAAIPHGDRLKRALPPKYLSVKGFKTCLVNYAQSTSTHWCFPLERPDECRLESWRQLAILYGAIHDDSIEKAKPDYFQTENFQNCAQLNNEEEEYCRPESQPVHCPDSLWERIQEQVPPCSEETFTQVAGFDLCLIPDQGSPFGWCKPKRQPAECLDASWLALNDVFHGEPCRSNEFVVGNDLGSLPPKYLVFPDYKDCLAHHDFESHSEYCLPRVKPADCKLSTWLSVRQVFDGIGCQSGEFNA